MQPAPDNRHPAHMSLFPTMNSTLEAVQYIEAQVPVRTSNEMFALVMMYHNTLLKEIASGNDNVVPFPSHTQQKKG